MPYDSSVKHSDTIPDEYRFIYGTEKISKKDRKHKERLEKFTSLLREVRYPEIFSIEDIESPNPVLYNKLKASYGSVSVPHYWKTEIKHTFSKGYIKKKYKIPNNVINTGILELRKDSQEDDIRLKAREKLFPKIGKGSTDPQKLYDCFFKHDYKPRFSRLGDVFYPTWEYFTTTCVPGVLSEELKEALRIDDKTPPSYLFNMQKIGMPPAYVHLKIPGLNAPIPKECVYGFEPCGWGEPLQLSYIGDIEERVEEFASSKAETSRYTAPIYMRQEDMIDDFVPSIKILELNPDKSLEKSEEMVSDIPVCRMMEDGIIRIKLMNYNTGGRQLLNVDSRQNETEDDNRCERIGGTAFGRNGQYKIRLKMHANETSTKVETAEETIEQDTLDLHADSQRIDHEIIPDGTNRDAKDKEPPGPKDDSLLENINRKTHKKIKKAVKKFKF